MSIRACLICLAAGDNLDIVPIEPLLSLYQALTGLIEQTGPRWVCWECAAHLSRFRQLRLKCLRALKVLNSLTINGDEITQDVVEDIDRDKYDLKSSLQARQILYLELTSSIDIHENTSKIGTHNSDRDEKKLWHSKNSGKKEKDDFFDNSDEVIFLDSDTETDDEKPYKFSDEKSGGLAMVCSVDSFGADPHGQRSSANSQKGAPHRENTPKIGTNNHDQNVKTVWLTENSGTNLRMKKEDECVDNFVDVNFLDFEIDIDNKKPFTFSGEKSGGLAKLCTLDSSDKEPQGPRSSAIPRKDAANPESPMKTEKKVMKHRKKPLRSSNDRDQFFSKFVDMMPMTHEEARNVIVKRQETSNYKRSPFRCNHCYKGFGRESTFKNHMNWHDPSFGTHECDACRLRYASRKLLLKHLRGRHRFKFSCRKCPYVCYAGSSALRHEVWHKGDSYSCRYCDEKFTVYSTMSNHIRRKHANEFSCSICGLCFVGRRGGNLHVIKVHGRGQVLEEGKHACDECDIKFITLEALQRHRVLSAKHNLKETTNGCETCGEVFPTRDAYLLHQKSHPPISWRKQRIIKQKKRALISSDAIQKGRAMRKTSKTMGSAGEQTANKNLICEICGKVLRSVPSFQGHLRTHSGERPYKCALCPKAFNAKQMMMVHMRTHTKERPYRCNECGRTFAAAGNYGRHLKTVHQTTNTVQCDICNKLSKNKVCLTAHIKFVHLKEPYPVRIRRRKSKKAVDSAIDDQLKAVE